jgi:sRNA-binding protein
VFLYGLTLQASIEKNIIADLEEDDIPDNERREAAISYYTRDWNYEWKLEAGAKRIDLDGKEVGTVTETEARGGPVS